jgi:hypothetical protein
MVIEKKQGELGGPKVTRRESMSAMLGGAWGFKDMLKAIPDVMVDLEKFIAAWKKAQQDLREEERQEREAEARERIEIAKEILKQIKGERELQAIDSNNLFRFGIEPFKSDSGNTYIQVPALLAGGTREDYKNCAKLIRTFREPVEFDFHATQLIALLEEFQKIYKKGNEKHDGYVERVLFYAFGQSVKYKVSDYANNMEENFQRNYPFIEREVKLKESRFRELGLRFEKALDLVLAVIEVESGFDEKLISSVLAAGIGQISVPKVKDFKKNPFHINQNLEMHTDILINLYKLLNQRKFIPNFNELNHPDFKKADFIRDRLVMFGYNQGEGSLLSLIKYFEKKGLNGLGQKQVFIEKLSNWGKLLFVDFYQEKRELEVAIAREKALAKKQKQTYQELSARKKRIIIEKKIFKDEYNEFKVFVKDTGGFKEGLRFIYRVGKIFDERQEERKKGLLQPAATV